MPEPCIRVARQVARSAATLTTSGPPLAESGGTEGGAGNSTGVDLLHVEEVVYPPTLSEVAAAVLHDELGRKLRALSQVAGRIDSEDTAELQDTIYDLAVHLAAGQRIINVVDVITKPGRTEPPDVARVRMDLAAYAYFCATLQEVFVDELDDARMIKATGMPSDPGSFDALAMARSAFATDTLLAWNLISQCRIAWSLEIRRPAGANVHAKDGPSTDDRPEPAVASRPEAAVTSMARPGKAARRGP